MLGAWFISYELTVVEGGYDAAAGPLAAAAGNSFPSLNLFLFNKCIQVTIFTTSIIWLLNSFEMLSV